MPTVTIQSQEARISFDAATGRLRGLCALPHGREYLHPSGAGGPFALWYGFARPYVFSASAPGQACHIAPDPAGIASGCLVPDEGTLAAARAEGQTARLAWREKRTGLSAELAVTLEGCASRWTLSVTNGGEAPQEVMPTFPWWRGLALSREAGGRMLAMNQAGYVGTLWHHRGGLYGSSALQSAQLGCLYERDTRDCLGFYLEDPSCRAKEILFLEPDVQVRWLPPRTLRAGETVTYPGAVLMLYAGSWKRTAMAYGDWFRRALRPDPVPEWVRRNESYGGAWAEKRGDEYSERPGGEPGDIPPNAMESFDELPVHYLRTPMETLEFALYCRQSQFPALREDGQELGPQPRRHTDGWNDIREDLGGMPALRRGVEAVHRMGRRVALYIEGLIVPDDSELFDHIPAARDWVVVNADGSTVGPYTRNRFVHMCPGCVEWQDHLVRMSVRLMREAGVDGIRLDSLGFYFWPCHNPAHRHESPYDYNRWLQDLYEKVARAVREVKPDALLSTEAPADFNHRHFNHSLHQIFSMELPYALGEEPSPLRVALPGYRLHTGAAVAGPCLQLQPLWGGHDAGNAPWLAAYPALAELFSGGDASLPDPVTDRPDMWCRRVRGAAEDLITGARASASTEKGQGHRLLPAAERARAQLSLPLGYEPAEAWIYDLAARTLEPLRWRSAGGTLHLTVETPWFAVLLRRSPGAALCLMEIPERVARGTETMLRIRAPALAAPRDGTLRFPGIGGMEAVAVKVPGEVPLRLPAGTRAGWYRAELSGQGLCPTVSIFKVTA